MESYRRDLLNLNDMAELRPILKTNQNTYQPRFSFIPKTGIAFPKSAFLFLLCDNQLISAHSEIMLWGVVIGDIYGIGSEMYL